MNVRPWFTLLAVASISLVAACPEGACDEHPRPGQVAQETPGDSPKAAQGERAEEEATRPDETEQAGVEGSEQDDETGPVMAQCVEVLHQFRSCSAHHSFIDAVGGQDREEFVGQTEGDFPTLINFLRQPGGARQTCQQLLLPEEKTPFSDLETLARLTKAAKSVERECTDFAKILRETGALEALGDVDI